MNVTIQDLLDELLSQKSLGHWPPAVRPRALHSFADLSGVQPQELERLKQSDVVADKLRLLGVYYRQQAYSSICRFFRHKPDRLGDEGKLLLVLAFLQLDRDKPDRLERHVAPLLKELVASDPSEFAPLYEWFQDLIQERPMSSLFYTRSSACPRVTTDRGTIP